MTMMACAAGKDVYCEKPLTLFVKEGRWLIDVAKKNKRIVQVGRAKSFGPELSARGRIDSGGKIGELVSIQNSYYRNVSPGFGNPPGRQKHPRSRLRYVAGSRARSGPTTRNRSLYHFRWFWDYSGGQMTNLGQHSLDLGSLLPSASLRRNPSTARADVSI
jgi:hypothetical protein